MSNVYLAQQSIRFLKAIKNHYGKEMGVDVLNALQPLLGKEWSSQVVFDLLADNHQDSTTIRVQFSSILQYRINAIKAVRTADGRLGLKEAKDLVENSIGGPPVEIKVTLPRMLDEHESEYDLRLQNRVKESLNDFNAIPGVSAWMV